LIGGRRSGKTHVICAVLVVFAVLNPGALLWAISPTLETGDELDENFRQLLPRPWYTRRQAKTGRATTFKLANGSRILLKSAVKPQRLKAGRVDLAFLNEAQELDQLAYVKVRAPIADRGGLVILAANPPDTPRGRWVEEHFAAAHAGRIECELFELDPRANPWINYEALASIGNEIDEKTYQRDVLGLFPPIGDVVMHAWSDRDSVAYPPAHFIDVTAEVTRAKLGHAAGYVSSKDFQQTPHMAATIHKFFRDPSNPDPEDIYEYIVDEVVVEDADELDLLDELERTPRWRPGDGKPADRDHADGYRGWREPTDDRAAPVHCAVVMDASAWWQDGAHTKGRQSDRVLASRRWVHCFRPRFEKDREGNPLRNNPEITERVKVCNSRLKTNTGRRRLFVAPHCEFTRKAMRKWENLKTTGTPNRRSPWAHACDTVSYVTYRFFGKPKPPPGSRGEYRGAGRYDRAAELRDW
ncbi:MAG TPA: hypothetical protein VN253_30220, partial [Kofleriaceae bacterium]|nr:hypothetical protein [Kofleriaceae bacterium]